MNGFTVEPYRAKKPKILRLAAVAIGLIALNYGNAVCEEELFIRGEAVRVPDILTVETTREYTESYLKDMFQSANYTNDYHLTLTENGKTIEFTADGCNLEDKIAYEWLSAPGYVELSARDRLDESEEKLIKDYRFGGWSIVVIRAIDDYRLYEELYPFYQEEMRRRRQ